MTIKDNSNFYAVIKISKKEQSSVRISIGCYAAANT